MHCPCITAHTRTHTHICRLTHTLSGHCIKHTATCPHKQCVPMRLPNPECTLCYYRIIHTHTAVQSAPMPLKRGKQHFKPNSFTSCADGESYWRNILYRSKPQGGTTTDSTRPGFTLALHFVLPPLLP